MMPHQFVGHCDRGDSIIRLPVCADFPSPVRGYGRAADHDFRPQTGLADGEHEFALLRHGRGQER